MIQGDFWRWIVGYIVVILTNKETGDCFLLPKNAIVYTVFFI